MNSACAQSKNNIVEVKNRDMCINKLAEIYSKSISLLNQASIDDSHENIFKNVELLDEAISIIGDKYVSDDHIDDTGMKLAIAEAEKKNGNMFNSLGLKKNVLISRLKLLEGKLNSCSKNDL